MGRLLPLVRTTPSLTAWGLANARAFHRVFGKPCGQVVLAVMFGQFAFETGWGNSCWHWNLGNERTGPLDPPFVGGWSGDYCELKTADEYDKAGKRIIVGGYFRANADLDSGAEEHWRFLASLKRYQPALAAILEAVDGPQHVGALVTAAGAFAGNLKLGGYYTGNLGEYASGLISIADAFFENDLAPLLAAEKDPFHHPSMGDIAEAYSLPWWTPQQRVEGDNPALRAIESFFPDEYHQLTVADESHLTAMLSCRYDCQPDMETALS